MLPNSQEIRKAESDIAKLQNALARLTIAAGHLGGYAKGDLAVHPWLGGITLEAIKSTPRKNFGQLFGVSDELGASLVTHAVDLVRDKPRTEDAWILSGAVHEAKRIVQREERKVDLFCRLLNPTPQDRAEWLVDLGRRLCVVFAAAKKLDAKAEEWEGKAQAIPGQPRADGLKPSTELLPLLDGWHPYPYSPAEEISALSAAFAKHFIELEKSLQAPIPPEWAGCGPAIWDALESCPSAALSNSVENALAPVDRQPTVGPDMGVVYQLNLRLPGGHFRAICQAGEQFAKAFAVILPMLRSGAYIRRDHYGESVLRHHIETTNPSSTRDVFADMPTMNPESETEPPPAAPVIAGPGKLSISRKDWIYPDGRQVPLPFGGEPAEQFEALASAPINTAIEIDPLAYRINTLVERVNKNCEAVGVDWRARKDDLSIRKATIQEWKDSRPPPRRSKPAKGRRKA